MEIVERPFFFLLFETVEERKSMVLGAAEKILPVSNELWTKLHG
jgi:hypothetical protein